MTMFSGRYDIATRPRDWYNGPVITAQIAWELCEMLQEMDAIDVHNVLEIGTMYGGTLLHLIEHAADDAQIIAVDWGSHNWRPPVEFDPRVWRDWVRAGQRLHYVEGDSHDPAIVDAIREMMPVVDFLLIDGDHTYEGVTADFHAYGPLVRPGGLIVFHDLVTPNNGRQDHIQVIRLWREIQAAGYKTREIRSGDERCGIGVVYV